MYGLGWGQVKISDPKLSPASTPYPVYLGWVHDGCAQGRGWVLAIQRDNCTFKKKPILPEAKEKICTVQELLIIILLLLLSLITLFLLHRSHIGTKRSDEFRIRDQLVMAPVSKAHQCMNGSRVKTVAQVSDKDSSAAK